VVCVLSKLPGWLCGGRVELVVSGVQPWSGGLGRLLQ